MSNFSEKATSNNLPATSTPPAGLTGPFLVYDKECDCLLNDGQTYDTLAQAEAAIKEDMEDNASMGDSYSYVIMAKVVSIKATLSATIQYQ